MLETVRALHQYGAIEEIRTRGRGAVPGGQKRDRAGIGIDHGRAGDPDADEGGNPYADRAGAESALFKRDERGGHPQYGKPVAQNFYRVAGAGWAVEGGAAGAGE